MAANRVSKFNWDKILSKVSPADARNMNILRGQANELTSNYGRYSVAPAEIDFGAYKKRVKFSGSAIDALEKAYKERKLPQYHATLPSFEIKKREMINEVVTKTVAAAKADLVSLESALNDFEAQRITKATSTKMLEQRFPVIAKEIEGEIVRHEWFKDNDHGCT